MPKSAQRCVLSMSYSRKDPSSSNKSSLSLADNFPLECCRATRASPPPSSARRLVSSNLSRNSRFTSGTLTAAGAAEEVLMCCLRRVWLQVAVGRDDNANLLKVDVDVEVEVEAGTKRSRLLSVAV